MRFVFFNPSTSDAPIYNALAGAPEIQLIKGIQEGAVVAMADGYARMSGAVGVAQVASIGLPSAMTQLVNSYKDGISVLLAIATSAASDNPQHYDHQPSLLAPITAWTGLPQRAADIAAATCEALRRAASGPVFLGMPDEALRTTATAPIAGRNQMAPAPPAAPEPRTIEAIAGALIAARSPLLCAGDEITQARAEPEFAALARLLGLPVTIGTGAPLGNWSRPFPTRDPLYIGVWLPRMAFPGPVDVQCCVGASLAERPRAGTTLISLRRAGASQADLAVTGDLKRALSDLAAAIRAQVPAARLRAMAADRAARVRVYSQSMARVAATAAHDLNSASSISLERLAVELEAGLERDTIYVNDCDSGRTMDPLLSFGGTDKTYLSIGPAVLGWAQAAAFGAKLACPDRPVVSVAGDGSAMFGGPQPLWSQARYNAPIINIVLNNRSYNNERNRIWSFIGGRQFQDGLDLTCYNGSPDIDFAKAAEAYGVQAEQVSDPAKLKAALARARHATREGRPYLLDVLVDRDGVGAASEWYPAYSVAAQRSRRV